MAAGLAGLVVGLALPPTRFLLDRILPKPGEGPGEKARARGHFTMDVYATTTSGARYTARFKAQGDPGYQATAVMFGQSALALALDREALPALPGAPGGGGGVLTPATGIGDALVDRLRAAGVEISAGLVGGGLTSS
jgi:short subunit dehydrogenase-like uncharacterized protein